MTEVALRAVIKGTGSALPRNRVSNAELANKVDTTDEWITERTGIKFRHIAAPDETTSSLAIEASRKALDAAGMAATDIDLIILATATPDQTFPASATIVQHALGCNGGVAFDVAAVCSGFLYAFSVAESMIRAGSAHNALVIGAETFSRILDWEDRTTCVLFGDGAGAVLIEASEQASGLLASKLSCVPDSRECLRLPGWGMTSARFSEEFFISLDFEGQEIFKSAVKGMSDAISDVLDKHNLRAEEIDLFIPHQANIRIIQTLAKRLNFPMEKVVVAIEGYANTSAASIPLALSAAVDDGRIKNGDVVAMEAIGGGLVWGAALVKFGRPS